MKDLRTALFTLFLMSCSFMFSQENITTSIIEPLQKDALFREKIFIHFNKSIYFTNENIWFKAYVAEDATNIPSGYTSNLNINLLNSDGNLIDTKTIFIQNGVGIGDFLINESYPSGKYFIQGYTNYMQNFSQQNIFIQEIEIINGVAKKEAQTTTNNYDIQVFPESGYLLEGIENTIGIKSLINGKGAIYSGKIVNSKNEEIVIFDGTIFGMSKCKFIYESNETYTAIIAINNTIQKIELPKATKTGIVFSIDNADSEKLKLTLKTNKETLPTLKDKKISILFYRNNFIYDAVTLLLNNDEQISQDLYFDKTKMLNGVNIVTLFKNNQPIAERKFYIDKPDEQTAVLIEELHTINDSINFKIQTVNSNFQPIVSQLSVSILPKESMVFDEKQHIKSAFLLSPYIKGVIENPSYYFKNENPNETEFLDLLLLNQGWSAYSLEEKIKVINPKEQFEFESGFTINGSTKKIPKGYDVAILSKKNRLVTFSEFNKQKEFSFENVFAYKNDSVKITLIKKNEALLKPNKITFTKTPKKEVPINYKTTLSGKLPSMSDSITSDYSKNFKAERLDEVVLKKVRIKRKETVYDKEMAIAEEHHEIAASFYQNKKVTEQMEVTYRTVIEYFTHLGFVKTTSSGANIISLRNTITSFYASSSSNINPDQTWPPKIYIDGVNIMSGNSYVPGVGNSGIQFLRTLQMQDVDEILINKTGAGAGIEGAGGIIKIYLKKGNHAYYEDEPKKLYQSLLLKTGFDRAKKYYTPLYNIYTKETFNWTEIDWKNSLQTDDNGEVVIKVPTNTFSNEFQFIINGFTKSGLLLHYVYKTSSKEF